MSGSLPFWHREMRNEECGMWNEISFCGGFFKEQKSSKISHKFKFLKHSDGNVRRSLALLSLLQKFVSFVKFVVVLNMRKLSYFTLAFFSNVQSLRCRMAGLSPTNIFEASWLPFSCQSSQARATMANSPPLGWL